MKKKEYHQAVGKQSVSFDNPPYIQESASVVGNKENEGPLGGSFDVVYQEELMGEDSWEKAESAFQKAAVEELLKKAKVTKEEVRFLLAGDLLGQEIASSFGLIEFQLPVIGMYGACSTAGLELGLGAMLVAGGFAERLITVTSSHFASAERQFRFPLDYANQRPLCSTWTVTGSGAFLLEGNGGVLGNGEGAMSIGGAKGEENHRIKIAGATFGTIEDYAVKDNMNMGACMAPAACATIKQHLKDFNRNVEDYDKIITGDLGYVGSELLYRLLGEANIDITKKHMDCGIEIFDKDTQDTHSGGSGCGCAAVTLSAYILPKLRSGVWKRVLFAPTGALLSKVSFNEGQPVPGISHAVVLESE